MAKKKAKSKSVAKKSASKSKGSGRRVRTGLLVPASTLKAAKLVALEQGRNVGEVLGDWAVKGSGWVVSRS